VEYHVTKIEAPECDDWMFDKRESFNKLIRLKMVELLESLKEK
jgi:hypothetical protein